MGTTEYNLGDHKKAHWLNRFVAKSICWPKIPVRIELPSSIADGLEKVGLQAHPLRHKPFANPSRGPSVGLFSFCFKEV